MSTFLAYLPWIISTASAAAALIPASAVDANPSLKILTALVDFLALNVGHAKEGPTPVAVMSEIATGKPSEQRDQVDKT